MLPGSPDLLAIDDHQDLVLAGLEQPDAVRLANRLMREHAGDVAALVAEAWLFGATVARRAAAAEHACRVCGCTETEACDEGGGRGCHWVEPDLCSACARPIGAFFGG